MCVSCDQTLEPVIGGNALGAQSWVTCSVNITAQHRGYVFCFLKQKASTEVIFPGKYQQSSNSISPTCLSTYFLNFQNQSNGRPAAEQRCRVTAGCKFSHQQAHAEALLCDPWSRRVAGFRVSKHRIIRYCFSIFQNIQLPPQATINAKNISRFKAIFSPSKSWPEFNCT